MHSEVCIQPHAILSLVSKWLIIMNTHYCFSLFDSCIDRNGVYKVETIGDAYMVVSGLPERSEKHAQQIAMLSLELRAAVSEFKVPHLSEERLQLRIGINTGII